MNRNYFSAVALLPGVQFSPSNQMGNDTIVANGQTSQNTNVSVDGGYNADDALGTSSGAQVRTPLEAVQEFQVLTSMYDAEFGRASGAIVNAVSKSGTNQFRGVLFGYGAANALTAEDYFVQRNNLDKAHHHQARMGRCGWRADHQEQAALLREPRAPGRQPEPLARLRNAAGQELRHRRGPHRLEHAGSRRSPDQSVAQLGGALAPRMGAAVEHDRQPPDAGIGAGRNRPRSNGGRHADQRDWQLARQHGAHRADVGALVARQRLLPRAGLESRSRRFQLRRGDRRAADAVPAAARAIRASSVRPAPNRRDRGTRTIRSRTTSRGSFPARRATTK